MNKARSRPSRKLIELMIGTTRRAVLVTTLVGVRVWDFKIIERMLGETDPLKHADTLVERIDEQRAAEWRKGAAREWAAESFHAAVKHVYAGVEPDGEPSHLDATYVSNGEKVIDEQLTRAGVRLADMLNAIFQE